MAAGWGALLDIIKFVFEILKRSLIPDDGLDEFVLVVCPSRRFFSFVHGVGIISWGSITFRPPYAALDIGRGPINSQTRTTWHKEQGFRKFEIVSQNLTTISGRGSCLLVEKAIKAPYFWWFARFCLEITIKHAI